MNEQIQKIKEQIKNEKSPVKKAELLLELGKRVRFYSPEEAKRCAIQALAIAKEKQDSRIMGLTQNFLGEVLWREGKIDEALECAKKALNIAETIKDIEIQSVAHSLLGLVQEQKGELDLAIQHYEKGLELVLATDDEIRLAAIYNNLGNAYWDKGDLTKALEYHEKSLAIKEKLKDTQAISISLNNLGLLYEDLGDLEKAIEFFYRALVEKEKCNDRVGISSCYNNLGEIYLKRGRFDKAIQLFKQAIKAAEMANAIPRKAEACGNLGNAYFLSGDYIRSMNYYIEDMNLALKIDDKFELSEIYWRMGELLLTTNEELEAFEFLQKSVALSSEIGAKKNEASAYRVLGKYYARRNDLVSAKSYFERGIELLSGIGKCYEIAKIYFDYGSYLAKTGIRDTALRYLREASTIFRRLEIISESETVERLLFRLEAEKDRRIALIKSLSNLTSQLLTVAELASNCLSRLQEALLFDAGIFFVFESRPFVLGDITEEEALVECEPSELEITPQKVKLPLRLAGRDLGLIYLRWKNQPPYSFDTALFETISNLLSLALEHSRVRTGLPSKPVHHPSRPETIVKPKPLLPGIIGESPKMLEIFDTLTRVAPTKACVLITGESGTGKELIAKTIHNQSPRAKKPFVAINCAAIPESLLESELFGIEKGTATGVRERIGKFEQANEGTIFLDEVGDMSLALQAKLLRFLQEKKFERVGSRKTVEVDVRIIAATNKDLKQGVLQGKFREDLFYRLNVINIQLPPLRERKEDIPQLANYFVRKFCEETDRKVNGITPEAMEILLAYSWPGNVRELENTIERAVILTKKEYITPADLSISVEFVPEKTNQELITKKPLSEVRASSEKDFILQLLARYNWNVTRAVQASGISRSQFYRLLAKYNIKRTE